MMSNTRSDDLIRRNLQQVVCERLTTSPVVVLTGPRTVGKSTLLAACARLHDVAVTDLDDLASRRFVAEDPGYFVSDQELVCIDEFQHVPTVLDAIKAELNQDSRPGRYLLTGSTRYGSLPRMSQSLTGRVHIMNLWPFSQGEFGGYRETFLDALISDPSGLLTKKPSTTSRRDYEEIVLSGGFPMANALPSITDRKRWFSDYVNTVIDRDVLEIRKVRQRRLLPVILRHLAARTGSVVQASELASRVELDNRLIGDYIGLLQSVFLLHRLEAFGRTLSARVAKAPKLHMVDTGLAATLLGVTQRKLEMRDTAALSEFGHLVETFTVNELIKQAGWSDTSVEFSHFRTRDQQEVDLVVESDDGAVSAVEVKSKASVEDKDFRGLRMLRDKLGSDFVGGAVLNLGTHSYRYDERLYVMPLDRLWTSASRAGDK